MLLLRAGVGVPPAALPEGVPVPAPDASAALVAVAAALCVGAPGEPVAQGLAESEGVGVPLCVALAVAPPLPDAEPLAEGAPVGVGAPLGEAPRPRDGEPEALAVGTPPLQEGVGVPLPPDGDSCALRERNGVPVPTIPVAEGGALALAAPDGEPAGDAVPQPDPVGERRADTEGEGVAPPRGLSVGAADCDGGADAEGDPEGVPPAPEGEGGSEGAGAPVAPSDGEGVPLPLPHAEAAPEGVGKPDASGEEDPLAHDDALRERAALVVALPLPLPLRVGVGVGKPEGEAPAGEGLPPPLRDTLPLMEPLPVRAAAVGVAPGVALPPPADAVGAAVPLSPGVLEGTVVAVGAGEAVPPWEGVEAGVPVVAGDALTAPDAESAVVGEAGAEDEGGAVALPRPPPPPLPPPPLALAAPELQPLTDPEGVLIPEPLAPAEAVP